MKKYYVNVSKMTKFVEIHTKDVWKVEKIEVPPEIIRQQIYEVSSEEEAVERFLRDFPIVQEFATKHNLPMLDAAKSNNVIYVSEIKKNKK